jgi:formylglycine-generating enzyme required for sulfatase activity
MKRMIILFLIVTMEIVMVGCSGLDSPLNDDKAITAFNFATPYAAGVITEATHTIDITVPYGTNVTSLTPTITYTGKSISPASGAAQDFSSPVTYTVTATNGSPQAYIVTVTISLSSENTITAFNVTSPVTATGVIDETANTIAITVPYGTNVTSLTPTITYTGKSISPATGVAQNFTSPVTYTVTAADSSTRAYIVTVMRESSNAKAITAFNFASPAATGIINEAMHTIAVTIPIGTDRTSLTPTIIYTGASISPASGVAQDFTSPVTYTVTDWNIPSQTQDYTVTVTIWDPSSLIMIPVPSGTFQRDATSTNTSYVSAFHMSNKDITRSIFTAVTGLPDPSDTTVSTGTSDPVQRVNWYHALVFCNKLSMLERLTPVYTINGSTDPAVWIAANEGAVPTASNADWDAATANWSATGYRLPTEMEWMWAAMGATSGSGYANPTYLTGYGKLFAGSDSILADGSGGTHLIGDYAWTSINSGGTTHPVGTKLANELGLYDMSGNVFEWCWDWWVEYPTGALTDYRGAASGTQRVGHGGSFATEAVPYASIAYHTYSGPSGQYNIAGFRIVRQP